MSAVHLFVKFSILLANLAFSNLICFSCAEPVMKTIKENVVDFENYRVSYAHFPKDLRHLTNVEKDLFFIIKKYVSKLGSTPDIFKRYIADYEESSQVAFNGWNNTFANEEYFVIQTNPLWSFRMIWRFVTDMPKIRNYIFSSDDFETRTLTENAISPSFVWPTKEDLNDSMDCLLNLHFVYDLNLTEFANGIITNIYTNASLAAIHCFDIAQYALRNNKQYTLAVEWLEIADIKRLDVSGHPILDYLDEISVSDLLEDIIEEHDTVWSDKENSIHMYQYYNKMSSKYIWLPVKTFVQRQYKKGNAEPKLSVNDLPSFSTLCQGGNLQSEKEKSELHCWYESKINPVWYINPQKMELLSKHPYIVQVYDFIGEEMTKYLIRESAPFMKKSAVAYHRKDSTIPGEKLKKVSKYSKERTSMSALLYEHKYEPKLTALSRKMGYISGLAASWGKGVDSDELQFAVYATGGYNDVHVDPLKDNDFGNNGNRLSSFIFYLNDVELGGQTAFTSVGVASEPVKGSAIFWYNLKHNGQVDYRVWHGGCPVLLGEKWSKKIRQIWVFSNSALFMKILYLLSKSLIMAILLILTAKLHSNGFITTRICLDGNVR